jgi:hypothetical protein
MHMIDWNSYYNTTDFSRPSLFKYIYGTVKKL